jgi:hypothetical protein
MDLDQFNKEWAQMLEDGVVFDWAHPVVQKMIVERKSKGTWYASSKSQGRVVIWQDDAPAPKPPGFKFAGNEIFELDSGIGAHGDGDIWNCFVKKAEHPEWDADTYWPQLKEST